MSAVASNSNTFTLLGNDGYSPGQRCQDPIAINFQTGNPCAYNTTSTNSVKTNTPISLFASKVKQPSPKYAFLDYGNFPGLALAALGVLPVQNKNLDSKFIFNLRKDGCTYRNTDDSYIFYGDYVQLSIMDGSTRKYYSPGNGGNGFSTTSNNCKTDSWETFQVLKVNADGSFSTAGNSSVKLEDNIILINTSKQNAIQIYTNSDGTIKNSAGLDSKKLSPLAQHAENFQDTPLTHETLVDFMKEYNSDNPFTTTPWYIYVIIVLGVILSLVYVGFPIFKKIKY